MTRQEEIHHELYRIREEAERIPELEAELIMLDGDPGDEVRACPVCGNIVRNHCYHDGQDFQSVLMLRREAAERKRANG